MLPVRAVLCAERQFGQCQPLASSCIPRNARLLAKELTSGDCGVFLQVYPVNVKTPVKHVYLDPAERAVTGEPCPFPPFPKPHQ